MTTMLHIQRPQYTTPCTFINTTQHNTNTLHQITPHGTVHQFTTTVHHNATHTEHTQYTDSSPTHHPHCLTLVTKIS